MTINGLHHITLVCRDAQSTIDFYTRVLGLRLVKKTVNFDDPGSYHLYFGDELGRPGSAVTFFEWPHAPRGRPGIGGTHHFALAVNDADGLLRWKRRLTDLGLKVEGPLDRVYLQVDLLPRFGRNHPGDRNSRSRLDGGRAGRPDRHGVPPTAGSAGYQQP